MSNDERSVMRELSALELDQVSGGITYLGYPLGTLPPPPLVPPGMQG